MQLETDQLAFGIECNAFLPGFPVTPLLEDGSLVEAALHVEKISRGIVAGARLSGGDGSRLLLEGIGPLAPLASVPVVGRLCESTTGATMGKDDEYHWGDNGSSGVVSPWPVAPPVPSHPSADYVPDNTNPNDDYNLCALARLERMPSGRLAPDSSDRSRCHSLLHAVRARPVSRLAPATEADPLRLMRGRPAAPCARTARRDTRSATTAAPAPGDTRPNPSPL